MSEVYILEPPTNGKVILTTTHGNLDVELWAKECPKACRNFLQLCVDGYYDDTAFHRVIKDFIVQGGDPTGTGQGGESIYGNDPFPLEIHPRLKFRYRGLVGLAVLDESEENTEKGRKHGSQFFITLGRADFLNGKHTIFGKITGHSLYNLLSISDVNVDSKTDRPLDPLPKIISAEVLYSPFGDLQPRSGVRRTKKEEGDKSQTITNKRLANLKPALQIKKSNLLSFEQDDDPVGIAVTETQCNDKPIEDKTSNTNNITTSNTNKLANVEESIRKLKERVAEKQKTEKEENGEKSVGISIGGGINEEEDESESESDGNCSESDEETYELEKKRTQRKKNAEELDTLRKEILAFKKGEGTERKGITELDRVQDADLLTEAEKRRRLYVSKSRLPGKRRREETTMSKLNEFTKRLREPTSNNQNPETENGQEDADWMEGGGLRFAVDSARAYELDAANDTLISIDPLANKSKKEIEERRKTIKGQRTR